MSEFIDIYENDDLSKMPIGRIELYDEAKVPFTMFISGALVPAIYEINRNYAVRYFALIQRTDEMGIGV